MKNTILAFSLLLWGGLQAQTSRTFVERHLMEAAALPIKDSLPAQQLVHAARWMLGQPYIAGRLEQNPKEDVVVDLYALDCVTFVEYALACQQSMAAQNIDFEKFSQQLQAIRYKNGVVAYPTRLHYLSDWLLEAQKNGLLQPVLNASNARPIHKALYFMTGLKDKEPRLKDPTTYKYIRERETFLSEQTRYYWPVAMVSERILSVQAGDVITFCSKKPGLDMEHVGLAVIKNGEPYLLHASKQQKKVVVSTESLVQYLAAHPQFIGIEVWRLP